MVSQINSVFKVYSKVFGLLTAMLVGALLPGLHIFSPYIQYLLMVMLFFAFLDIEFKPAAFQKSVLWVLLANVAVAFLSYAVLVSFNMMLALAAFMTAIAPTAIAAPVLISFIQGKIEYVIAAVLVTNLSSAVIIPLTLPFLLGADVHISIWEVLEPVLIVMLLPLLLARLTSHLPSRTQQLIRAGKSFSFPLWIANLLIVSANASSFLRNENSNSALTLMSIALISLVLCIVNFGVGALLGGPRNWQEASQSLGQKNLSFVIWIALTFVNPLVAMGPTFYILYHHLYNSWSIYRFEKRRSA
jgi:bile acid:Na+ symporter, BASS family